MMDLDKIIDDQHNGTLAVAKIANTFLEGLHDNLAAPELHSDAAELAHHLLGCDNWTAMFLLASILHDAPDAPEAARAHIDTMLRDQLVHFAVHVVRGREPIAPCTCEGYAHG